MKYSIKNIKTIITMRRLTMILIFFLSFSVSMVSFNKVQTIITGEIKNLIYETLHDQEVLKKLLNMMLDIEFDDDEYILDDIIEHYTNTKNS